jgi:3-hydroxybutyryl-CoA dehydrogenase
MGLMGTSITACLLAAGHQVACVEADPSRRRFAKQRLLALLNGLRKERLLLSVPATVIKRWSISSDYAQLSDCGVVIESVFEDLRAKKTVLRRVERVVRPNTLIATNTSSIPVTELQKDALRASRVLGMHWAEPAHITRFMEIICGRKTTRNAAERAMALARHWGKEPVLVRRDVRGFVTNRVMYAMLREAFYLVESGVATPADVDRSLRNDLGYWITFAGPFRFMDLTGIPAYAAVMRDLLPDLDRSTSVPRLMRKLVRSGAQGVANGKGFYRYRHSEAKRWQKLFEEFTYQIRALAQKYPEDAGDQRG